MNKIILIGPATCGKDYLRKKFTDKKWKYGVAYTTRPIRKNEIDGVEYHFISVSKFKNMINNNKFIEFCVFNEWYYGTSVETWKTHNLFIMTVCGITQLNNNIDMSKTFTIYLNIDKTIRYRRLIERKDADSAKRRFLSDLHDFKNFKLYDLEITNSNF